MKEKRKSLTGAYVIMFDRLPPLLETMDYEDDFYQDLMGDALISGEPITEKVIEDALSKRHIQYDTAETMEKGGFSHFKK